MIDSDKIYAYFDDNHGPLEHSTNGWYDGECPFCRSKKLAINPDSLVVKCWKGCFYGSVVRFVKEYLGCEYRDAAEILDGQATGLKLDKYGTGKPKPVKDLVLPDGYNRILDGSTHMGNLAREYLKGRGFDLNYLDMIGVGYCDGNDYMGYIIVPFKKDGKVVYFIGRDYMNRGELYRYKNPPRDEFGIGKSEVLFNEEALYLYDKVYLLEGWTDAATIGNNATSIQGKSLAPLQQDAIIRSTVQEVIVISDLGAEKEALNIVEKIYKYKATKLIKLQKYKDEGKDVNEIGAEKVLSLEPDARYINTLYDFQNEARSINTCKKKLII